MLFAIRIVILVLVYLVISIPVLPLFLLFPRSPVGLYYGARIYSYVGFKILGIKVEKRNLDNFEKARPGIIISNHQSYLDMLMGSYSIPKYTVSLGKRAILYLPFFGFLYWLSGNILINRSNKKQAYATMENIGKEIKRRKIFVWIMAEGTRNKRHSKVDLLPLKKGPFYVATGSEIPLIPVTISRFTNLNYNKWFAGKVIIEAHSPISTVGKTRQDIPELISFAQNLMETKIKEISLEVQSN